jgi:PhnB protein
MKTKPKKRAKSAKKSVSYSAGRTTKPTKPAKPSWNLTPYIIVKSADAAIAFYKKILGAKEKYRLTDPQGHVGHAELRIGEGQLFLADESPAFGAFAPPTIGGSPVRLHLYVADVDRVIKEAAAAGATVLRPAADQFYGDRSGMIADPFGHQWYLATRGKMVSPSVMQKRYAAMFENKGTRSRRLVSGNGE